VTSATPRDWIATYDPADPALRSANRRKYQGFATWTFVPSFLLTYLPVYVGIDVVDGTAVTAPHRLFAAPYWLAVATFVVALTPIVASLVFGLRRARWAAVMRNPRAVLTRAQGRRVDRQIRGRLPVALHEVPFLRDVALGMYAQRWVGGVMAGTVLLALSAGMLGPPAFGWFAVVPVAVGAASVRAALRGRRFLRSVGVAPV
jgi:hypothetical protein